MTDTDESVLSSHHKSRDQERLGKGVPVEETDTECPHCETRNLVKPRSEVEQCPECLFVNNPMYMGNEGRDFNLTHRQGRLLLRAFGYRFGGTAGDIENRLRQMCSELEIDREELNTFLADVRQVAQSKDGDSDE